MSEKGEAFIAGILAGYDALLHFLCPTTNSMRRLEPSMFSGAYKFWSIENKEAPIRVTRSFVNNKIDDNIVTNFEIKSLDHTANVYFALAAITVLGINGMNSKM